MRYDLCEYIIHNKLPIGNEPELIDNIGDFPTHLPRI